MDRPGVAGIFIYPIKSLDGLSVEKSVILPTGALQHDREFALFDEQGACVNAKRNARIHLIRANYDIARWRVTLRSPQNPDPKEFDLIENQSSLEEWLGSFLGYPVRVKRNTEMGFPDDIEAPGPTIASLGTFAEVGSWFEIQDSAETRRRFRPNVVIETDTPFWEDRLFGTGEIVEFRIGDVTLHGINPCQRCVVPTRGSEAGTVLPGFQKLFAERRAASLPTWAEPDRFTHYYRLAVNTRIPSSQAGKSIRVGDPIGLGGPWT